MAPSSNANTAKQELIADIRELAPTATERFLAQFGEADLSAYLEHLRHAGERRIAAHGWVARQIAARKMNGFRKPIPRSNLRKAS